MIKQEYKRIDVIDIVNITLKVVLKKKIEYESERRGRVIHDTQSSEREFVKDRLKIPAAKIISNGLNTLCDILFFSFLSPPPSPPRQEEEKQYFRVVKYRKRTLNECKSL